MTLVKIKVYCKSFYRNSIFHICLCVGNKCTMSILKWVKAMVPCVHAIKNRPCCQDEDHEYCKIQLGICHGIFNLVKHYYLLVFLPKIFEHLFFTCIQKEYICTVKCNPYVVCLAKLPADQLLNYHSTGQYQEFCPLQYAYIIINFSSCEL